ncbi:hypothetical protein C8R45DRAFT_421613 [Mycena sanguinolenta]|nr:hypothetical protein C8R45DRAFT_421613 [Mycena sanguinolenta]
MESWKKICRLSRLPAILMPFEALGEDILLSILCFCDVYTVLAVSATNKLLRRVALAKQLWLSLVQDSVFRAALDLLPPDRDELESHSTEELIEFVKSTVVGPGLPATITHTNYKIPLPELGNKPVAQLLPGARYILLQNTTREQVYIYDVWSARRVWECPVHTDTICKVDLVPGGALARVLLAQSLNSPNKNRLHIEEVDLISGISRQVFELGCPQYLVTSRFEKYAIVGEFFLCTMLFSPSLVWHAKKLLVNWRTSAFVDLGNGPNFVLELIPGYVVWTDLQYLPSQQQVLAVTALDQFANDWQPLSEDCLAARLKSGDPPTPTIAHQRLEYNNCPLGARSADVHLTVTPSALHRAGYNISVQAGEIWNQRPARNRTLPPVVRLALLVYRFTPACEMRLVSAQRVWRPTPMSRPRATAQLSNESVIVSYLQREWPSRDHAT